MGGQFCVNGLQVGIGPPPPGTLLGVMEATVEFLGEEFPAKAAARMRVRASMRIISFIDTSPPKVVCVGYVLLPESGID
jgi:hypothetical protein